MTQSVVVIGAGAFGLGTALELKRRGYNVTVIDSAANYGANPLAASTDISKIIRGDYGLDEVYVEMHQESRLRWLEWNSKWAAPVYHETGMLVLSKEKLERGKFAGNSYYTLLEQGYPLERLQGAEAIQARFPAWNSGSGQYVDGYFNPRAGWAESGRVIAHLLQDARAAGVTLIEGHVEALVYEQPGAERGRVRGVALSDGRQVLADWTVSAAGAWSYWLLPQLRSLLTPRAQIVFHFALPDQQSVAKYSAPTFPVYCADIQTSGFYGFPFHPREKCLKVGFHGLGHSILDKRIDRGVLEDVLGSVRATELAKFRAFLESTFPDLRDAEAVYSRACMYNDSTDGHFIIDHDPDRPGLVIATGGSGHGFKFVPVIGGLIADVLERKPNRWAKQFVWRQPSVAQVDACRCVDQPLPAAVPSPHVASPATPQAKL
eukprot:TRINITY_DN7283_c0_g1_i1.p1 TRINITY_DN7283_c0_g1~~TRINITY_DN7283_c0_g1_i1.p1  ORF type:complete len:433 (+),score=106.84 TRINITY_DN7283_c0_g1_i1:144-1442(+)